MVGLGQTRFGYSVMEIARKLQAPAKRDFRYIKHVFGYPKETMHYRSRFVSNEVFAISKRPPVDILAFADSQIGEVARLRGD